MAKVIIWLVVIFAVLFALRLYSAAKSRARGEAARARQRQEHDRAIAPMVRCVQCGVFLPKADAQVVPTGYRCTDPGCAARR